MARGAAEQAARRPKVFVIEQQPYDYNPALVYGDIVFMDPRRLAPHVQGAPDSFNQSILSQIRNELSDYIPGHDFITPTGAPIRMMAVGMILAEKGRVHKLLGYDNRTQRYLQYVINLGSAYAPA